MNQKGELQQGIVKLGIELGGDIQEKLIEYLVLLNKWNKVYNLTAIRDPNRMVSNHLLDSLAVLPHLWDGKWLDVGSGSGLPGIVLAMAKPDWEFTLIDSNSKKTSFIQQAVIELGLPNVTVKCLRVEEWKPVERFDGIISRAFSDLGSFMSKTRHLIASGGRWAAMKGAPEQELENISNDCKVEKIIPISVPGLNASRSLVIASCEGKN